MSDGGFEYRPELKKVAGNTIPTTLFLDPKYGAISGILYSRASVNFLPQPMGGDFIFIHNPLATNPVHHGFFKLGQEYYGQEQSKYYIFSRKNWGTK